MQEEQTMSLAGRLGDAATLGLADTQGQTADVRGDADTQASGAGDPGRTFAPGTQAQPTQFGRYVILSRIGGGGMGVVHAAYDPDLDRKIAIKLVTPSGLDGEFRIRLLREAQAMAKLSHPQVVQVHDVGVLGGQVFVAMEFVQGVDLATWLTAGRRAWSEVLRVYIDAGRGLAAAHAAGIVHRDFKPGNVLIGTDGRVRVADFGLAHRHGLPAGTVGTGAEDSLLSARLTRTGEVMGTPAYMSPEQYAGTEIDARSDQFSFCVALFEGLHGVRPFSGETFEEMRAAVFGGRVVEPAASATPRWLLPILRRGLAVRPEDRYQDLPALLAALERDPRRTRRRWLLGLGGGALAATLAATLLERSAGACTDAGQALADTWSADRRDELDQRLAQMRGPLADETRTRVLAGLDAYADAWVTGRTNSCIDHQRGFQSEELLDRRMRCLDNREYALGDAVRVITGIDEAHLSEAMVVVARLPVLAACEDVASLMAEVPRPDDPRRAAVADELDHRLITGRTALHAGELARAASEARTVEAAAETDELWPQLAAATLLRGEVEMSGGDLSAAPATLRLAFVEAVRASRDSIAAEALARWMYVTGADHGESTKALAELPLALALVDRLPRPGPATARLQNNVGVIHLVRRDRAAALKSFSDAVRAADASELIDPIERANYQANLAMVTADAGRRTALLTGSMELLRDELGARHVLTIARRIGLAAATIDPRAAAEIQASACDDLMAAYPDLARQLADCRYDLGRRYTELGQADQAVAALRQAADVRAAIRLEDADERERSGWVVQRDRAFAEFHAGAPARALAELDAVLPVMSEEATGRWWLEKRVAEGQLVRGQALLELARPALALEPLTAARTFFARIVGDQERADVAYSLAAAEIGLAEALWRTGDDRRARDSARAARAFYVSAGEGYAPRVARIDALLVAPPTPDSGS